jgi:hypothetical protein
MVLRTARMLVAIYRTESETAEKNVAATRAFDDIVLEIARAGYGLGEGVQAVLPSPAEITIRSNEEGLAATLEAELSSSGGRSLPRGRQSFVDRGGRFFRAGRDHRSKRKRIGLPLAR